MPYAQEIVGLTGFIVIFIGIIWASPGQNRDPKTPGMFVTGIGLTIWIVGGLAIWLTR